MRSSEANQPIGGNSRGTAFLRGPSRLVMLSALAIGVSTLIAAGAIFSRGDTVENGPVAAFASLSEGQLAPSFRDLLPVVMRNEVISSDFELTVIYTPPLYYRVVGQQPPPASLTQPSAIFVLQESSHIDDLTARPAVFLLGPNGERIGPIEARLISEDPHHRSTRLTFPVAGGVLGDRVTVIVPGEDDGAVTSFVWELPLRVPGAASDEAQR